MALALWTQFGARAPLVPVDPRAQLIGLFERAGFTLLDTREMIGGAEDFVLRPRDCDAPANILLIRSLHRDFAEVLTAARRFDGDPVYVFGGQTIVGLSASDLAGRWALRKVRVALDMATPGPWDSMAVAAFLPRACPPAAIDWSALR